MVTDYVKVINKTYLAIIRLLNDTIILSLSACPAYSGLGDFGLEKTLPLYFVDEKHLVGI